MQFLINEVVNDDGGFFVYQIPDILKNPKEFTLYADDVTSADPYASIRRELAYSMDGSNWSNWQPLTSSLLKDEKLLGKGDLNVRIKFTKNSGNSPIQITTVDLDYTATPDDECAPKMITTYMGLEMCNDVDFDPFKISAQAAQLESALNGAINKTIGMEVQYFHVKPDLDNEDSILNEYSTWKESGKGGECIKLMVPENSLPDPSLLHTEFGIDFEKFNVDVQIQYFETIFGKDEEPRQEDIIYFPKFNKLFYVSSAKAVRGTDGIGQYFEMSLKKYDRNTAVKKSAETDEILDALIKGHSHDDNFAEKNQKEGLDITNPIQNETKTIALDNLRSFIDPALKIDDYQIFNNGTPISNHNYNLTFGAPGQIGVIYKPQADIKDDLALTFWLNRNNPLNITDDTTMYYRNINNYLPFAISSIKRLDLKRVQVVVDKAVNQTGIYANCFIQQGNNIFYVSQVIDDYNFVVNTPDIMPNGTYRIATCEILPSTYAQMQGVLVALVSGRYIYIILGQSHFKFDTGLQVIVDEWMAFVINISATYSYIETYVYAIDNKFPQYPGKYSTVLRQLSKQSKPIMSAITGYANLQNNPMYLMFSNSKITNIRLWNTPIEEEIHSLILNQPQVQAVSKTFIIDNADPVYRLDKLGRGIKNYFETTPDVNPEE